MAEIRGGWQMRPRESNPGFVAEGKLTNPPCHAMDGHAWAVGLYVDFRRGSHEGGGEDSYEGGGEDSSARE